MEGRFAEKVRDSWQAVNSLVCVGLDPLMDRLPEVVRGERHPVYAFNVAVIEATAPYACAYKPQFAHYAAAGRLEELLLTMDYLRREHADKLVILDGKRGDIGSTAAKYAEEAFVVYGADAVTVNPYLGGDTLAPFLEDPERGIFVLCKTSNPGSADFQDLELSGSGRPLYAEVARRAQREWNGAGNVGLVTGATYPGQLARVREEAPDLPLLVPGIGAQGGDLEATLRMGLRGDGGGLLINSSRGILYASGGTDFAEAAAEEACRLRDACREVQAEIVSRGGAV